MSLENKLQNLIRKLAYLAAISGSLLMAPKALPYHAVPEGESKNVSSITPSAERKVCHRDLTFEIAESYKKLYGDTQTAKDLDDRTFVLALAQGAVDEDDDNDEKRSLQHYYNPTRNEKEDGLIMLPFNDGSKDALSRAKELLKKAISLEPQDDKREAYHTIGCVMHLLEDMGVPENVYLIPHTNGSSYEDYCAKKSLDKILVPQQKIQPLSIEDLFRDMANASLQPVWHLRTVFIKNYEVGNRGNGSYVEGKVAEEDCKKIAEYLVPEIIGKGVALLRLWDGKAKGKASGEREGYTSLKEVDLADYVFLPKHNIYISKNRLRVEKNWFEAHEELHKRKARMATIREYVSFLDFLWDRDQTCNQILSARIFHDGEWLDAAFSGTDEQLYISYNNRIIKGKLAPLNYEIIKDSQPPPGKSKDEGKNAYPIALNSWWYNPTVHGLPNENVFVTRNLLRSDERWGRLDGTYYMPPKMKGNLRVAKFYVESQGAFLNCNADPYGKEDDYPFSIEGDNHNKRVYYIREVRDR